MFTKCNKWVADRVNAAYSSVTTAYVFTVLSVLPMLFPAWMATILYVSNAIQLDSMAFIGVSSAVAAAATMRLIKETHDTAMAEMRELKLIADDLHGLHRAMHEHFGIVESDEQPPP
jgi:hypothetical protein